MSVPSLPGGWACRADNVTLLGQATVARKHSRLVASLDECKAECASQINCRFIVHNRYRRCYLKSTRGAVVTDSAVHQTTVCERLLPGSVRIFSTAQIGIEGHDTASFRFHSEQKSLEIIRASLASLWAAGVHRSEFALLCHPKRLCDALAPFALVVAFTPPSRSWQPNWVVAVEEMKLQMLSRLHAVRDLTYVEMDMLFVNAPTRIWTRLRRQTMLSATHGGHCDLGVTYRRNYTRRTGSINSGILAYRNSATLRELMGRWIALTHELTRNTTDGGENQLAFDALGFREVPFGEARRRHNLTVCSLDVDTVSLWYDANRGRFPSLATLCRSIPSAAGESADEALHDDDDAPLLIHFNGPSAFKLNLLKVWGCWRRKASVRASALPPPLPPSPAPPPPAVFGRACACSASDFCGQLARRAAGVEVSEGGY